MLRMVLLFICFWLYSNVANSQLLFGVKAGPSLSSLNFDEGGSKITFHAGGFLTYAFSDLFFVQPELLYTIKGTKSDDILFDNSLLDIEMNYISIPLLLGVQAIHNLKIKAGPEINIPINSTTKIDDTEVSVFGMNEEMDLALCVGLSYQFLKNLGAEVRYSHGLSVAYTGTLLDVNGGSLGNFGERKTRTWQFSVFYLFGK